MSKLSIKLIRSNFFMHILILLSSKINSRTLPLVWSREAPTVYIPGQGAVSGTYMKMFNSQSIKAYLGIQYAVASRFSPPIVGTLQWKGVKNATRFGPNCWQQKTMNAQNTKPEMDDAPQDENYDENCLYLNLFIPDGPQSVNGYAVIVWIHPGEFAQGHSSDLNPFQFVFKQQVIVVTFSYRLNIFGFLSTADGEIQGNYGLMDQSAALFWVRRNINLFGGDDTQITIMGHASGSISAALHLTSGIWSKDTFNKAILMSGSPLAEKAVRKSNEYSNALDAIANVFGCFRTPVKKLIECLSRIEAKILSENLPLIEWGPTIENNAFNNNNNNNNRSHPFLIDSPIHLFENMNYEKVPILTGFINIEDNLNEMQQQKQQDDDDDKALTIEEFDDLMAKIAEEDLRSLENNDTMCGNIEIIVESLKYAYNIHSENSLNDNGGKLMFNRYMKLRNDKISIAPINLLANFMSKTNSTYVYSFNVKPIKDSSILPEWMSFPEAFDQIYIWGLPYSTVDSLKKWDSTDKRISDIVMTLWANFAKASNPTAFNVFIKWSKYDSIQQKILNIDRAFNSTSLKTYQNMLFWNSYYPKLLGYAMNCCNSTYNIGSHSLINSDLVLLLVNIVFIHLLFYTKR